MAETLNFNLSVSDYERMLMVESVTPMESFFIFNAL